MCAPSARCDGAMEHLISAAQAARDLGVGSQGLKHLVRNGQLGRVRRGIYFCGPAGGVRDGARRLILATAPLLGNDSVVSHTSAAIMHGLPVELALCGRVWTIRCRSRGGPSGVVQASDARLSADEVVQIEGVRVTCLARTVLDLARTRPFDWGVAVADAALYRGLTTRAELSDAARRVSGVPGVVRGRAVVAFADARAESVGESRSRAIMHQQGLPAPELQERLYLDGVLIGRSDFLWRDDRTVGEFDGALKYGELVPAGRTARDVVMAEKAREQAIRDAGWWIVRWGWRELADAPALAIRIRRGFELAPRR